MNFIRSVFSINNKSGKQNDVNIDIVDNLFKKLPYELKNIIFQYDGRIKYKYKHKNQLDYHTYVNVIHKHDTRYNVIRLIINKKQKIMKDTETRPNDTSFYFEFNFDKQPALSLCYDYNWSYDNIFEICYTDMKGSGHIFGSDQIRTYI